MVFIIGTNDAKSAPQDVADDDAWRDDYTVRVEQMMSTLIGDGRTVYWVGYAGHEGRARRGASWRS